MHPSAGEASFAFRHYMSAKPPRFVWISSSHESRPVRMKRSKSWSGLAAACIRAMSHSQAFIVLHYFFVFSKQRLHRISSWSSKRDASLGFYNTATDRHRSREAICGWRITQINLYMQSDWHLPNRQVTCLVFVYDITETTNAGIWIVQPRQRVLGWGIIGGSSG